MLEHLPLPDADLLFDPAWLPAAEAEALFVDLREHFAGRTIRCACSAASIGRPG